MHLADGKGGGPGVSPWYREADIPASSLPSVEAGAAHCFLLFLHCAVPVLDWLSWQLAHRHLCTFSRPEGVVLFPGKFLGCEDEVS